MTPRANQHDSISQQFEREFALEILKSDRLRITMLICAIGVSAIVIPVTSIFTFEKFSKLIQRSVHQVCLNVCLHLLGDIVMPCA